MRAGVSREVVEPHLDADRAARALLADERLAELSGEAVDHRLKRVEAAEVEVERGLARFRFRHAHRLHGAIVLEAGQPPQVGAKAVAEGCGQV